MINVDNVNDGDMGLVVNEDILIEEAEKACKDIRPLYYEMGKAKAIELNNDNLYNGMVTAYRGGNIGLYSNDISRIWNSEKPNLDVIKLLCMENNFVID